VFDIGITLTNNYQYKSRYKSRPLLQDNGRIIHTSKPHTPPSYSGKGIGSTHVVLCRFQTTYVRYITIETTGAARIGYNGFILSTHVKDDVK
jgi:hypothetical protein